jgi:hypothetical protein
MILKKIKAIELKTYISSIIPSYQSDENVSMLDVIELAVEHIF